MGTFIDINPPLLSRLRRFGCKSENFGMRYKGLVLALSWILFSISVSS